MPGKNVSIAFAELLLSSQSYSLLRVIAFHANEALMSTLGASVPGCFTRCHFGASTTVRWVGGAAGWVGRWQDEWRHSGLAGDEGKGGDKRRERVRKWRWIISILCRPPSHQRLMPLADAAFAFPPALNIASRSRSFFHLRAHLKERKKSKWRKKEARQYWWGEGWRRRIRQ